MRRHADEETQSRSGRIRRFIRSYRRAALVALGLIVALAAFVAVWFQPHKLFIEERVDEALPGNAAAGESADPTPGEDVPSPQEAAPETLASGDFRSLEHRTSGRALVLELADGRRFLRFEGLDTSNGPDLRVYLSEIEASDDWYAYGERFVDLGPLKGNIGDQNYRLPAGLDLSRFKSAVVWCRRFTVGFGVAPLE